VWIPLLINFVGTALNSLEFIVAIHKRFHSRNEPTWLSSKSSLLLAIHSPLYFSGVPAQAKFSGAIWLPDAQLHTQDTAFSVNTRLTSCSELGPGGLWYPCRCPRDTANRH
jgi:hypothetical protein